MVKYIEIEMVIYIFNSKKQFCLIITVLLCKTCVTKVALQDLYKDIMQLNIFCSTIYVLGTIPF